MPLDLTLLDQDVENIIGDLPVIVTFDGDTATCTRTSLNRDFVMIAEGLRDEYRFSIYAKSGDWDDDPEVDDIVTIASVEYRVLSRQYDNVDQLLRLDLGEKFAS